MRKISIIGAGRIGGALALALSEKYQIQKLYVRSPETARLVAGKIPIPPRIENLDETEFFFEDLIFIATQDSEIEKVSEKLFATAHAEGTFVFHLSGALSSEILEPLCEKNYRIGSIHPLVSVSDYLSGAEKFKDAFFCIEGEEDALGKAREIAEALGGKTFSIEKKFKPLYHAAAVTASGHFVALLRTAAEMLSICGVPAPEAKEILLPLVASTFENLREKDFEKALTGTFARGDVEVFKNHLEALEKYAAPEQTRVYLELGEISHGLAESCGEIDGGRLKKMREEISLAKKKFKC